MHDASDIAHIIQLAVAPVFLLAGIGTFMNVITARLGRVVDRARHLEEVITSMAATGREDNIFMELGVLDRRMVFAQRAIYFCTISALLVCMVVATLFVGTLVEYNVAAFVAILFIAAMLFLVGGLTYFLREIAIATRMLRVRTDLTSAKKA